MSASARLRPADILRRVPPQDTNAEAAVLGACLLLNEAIDDALGVLGIDDFYREAHRLIFQAMVGLRELGEPVDAITLCGALKHHGALEQIGGAAYIAELAALVPSAAAVGHYSKLVREKSLLRSLGSFATEVAAGTYEPDADAQEMFDQVESRMLELSERRISPGFSGMQELTRQAVGAIETLYEKHELVTGLATGFKDVDRITAGLQAGNLIVVAARPGMGKTSLAMNIAARVGIEHRASVAVFSLEMSKEELALRMLCTESRVDMAKARAGYLSAPDFPKLAWGASRLSDAKIYIDDSSDLTPMTLRSRARRLHRQNKLALVVVDYLQLMRPAKASDSREREIAEISRSLKALAKELQIPVLALSQLNRAVEQRANRRPLLADLRESGAIEQDADVIMFIYRDEMYQKDSKAKGMAELIIAKQRNGPTDTALLTYISQYTRFEDFMQPEEL